MLVDLTIDDLELTRRKEICKENDIDEKILPSHPDNHLETGVYFNYGLGLVRSEFAEMRNLGYEDEYRAMVREWDEWGEGDNKIRIPFDMDCQYGVADNV